jgi:hypothetical protein
VFFFIHEVIVAWQFEKVNIQLHKFTNNLAKYFNGDRGRGTNDGDGGRPRIMTTQIHPASSI